MRGSLRALAIPLHVSLLVLAACVRREEVPPVPDAGAPEAPFAPRLLFEDRSVRCEVPPPLAMQAPPGPRPPRGTIRWVYNPSRDPATLAALAREGQDGLGLTGSWMTGMANGGFMTDISLARFYLGVSGDGRFAFLRRSGGSTYGASWLMPSLYATRDSSSSGGGSILAFEDALDWGHVAGVRLPSLPDGYPGSSSQIQYAGPALLSDGSVVYLVTERALSAACPDGRTRWVLELDSRGASGYVFASGDGNIVLPGRELYRIDPDGRVLASRERMIVSMARNYSDRCGLVFDQGDLPTPHGVMLYSGFDFSTVRELPSNAVPTNDCGWWSGNLGEDPGRFRPDGSLAFRFPSRRSSLARIELTDGSWLMVDRGGERPPAMTIVADDGTILFEQEFDPAVLGEVLTPEAFLLTPNGILYVTATSGFESVQQFGAIEVGIGPASQWAPTINGAGGSGNWARDGATWHPVPAAP